MARIGNETKLVLKLAAEKARRQPALQGVEPHGFPDDPRLHEAYVMGFGRDRQTMRALLST